MHSCCGNTTAKTFQNVFSHSTQNPTPEAVAPPRSHQPLAASSQLSALYTFHRNRIVQDVAFSRSLLELYVFSRLPLVVCVSGLPSLTWVELMLSTLS